MDQMEREEQAIEDDVANGLITRAQANKEIRELHLSYQAAAEEAAQDAYDREMERW